MAWPWRLCVAVLVTVLAVAGIGAPSAQADTRHHWRFETGAFTADSAGAATLTNSTATQAALPGTPGDPGAAFPRQIGGEVNDFAAQFSNDGGFTTTIAPIDGAWTVEMLARFDVIDGAFGQVLVISGQCTNRYNFLVHTRNDGALGATQFGEVVILSGDFPGAFSSFATGFAPALDTDYFMAVVYRDADSEIDFFWRDLSADGPLNVATGPFNASFFPTETDLGLGDGVTCGSFEHSGLLDEVRISDTALSAPEFLVPGAVALEPAFVFEGATGTSVSKEGSLLAVGDTSADAVRIYEAGVADPVFSLFNPNPSPDDFFADQSAGRTIARAGDLLVVSARGKDIGATDGGAVYVFDLLEQTLVDTITPPFPQVGEFFGAEVAATPSRIAVGTNAGRFYLFDVFTGSLVRSVVLPAGAATVSLSNFIVAAGSPLAESVRLYDSDGNFLRLIDNPTPELNDFFGLEVVAQDQEVLIAAPLADQGAVVDAGEAYLFDTGTGALVHTFVDPTPVASSAFGSQMAVEGDLVAIAAPQATGGEVHVFDRVTGALVTTINDPGVTGFVSAVSSVDLNEGYLVVGTDGGDAYLYAVAGLDGDGDGIADLIELRNGLNPEDPADADGDADDDTFTNLQEVRAGTRMSSGDPAAIGDRPGAGFATLAASFFSVREGETAEITLDRVWGNDGELAVRVETVPIPSGAVPGTDYQPIDEVVTWAAGDQARKSIVLVGRDDNATFEADAALQLRVTLVGVNGGVLTPNGIASVFDDDRDTSGAPFAGAIIVSPFEQLIPEHAGFVDVVVRRIFSDAGAVSVDYSTSGFSALPGQDYLEVAGTLSWADGDASDRLVRIPIVDDEISEQIEYFIFEMTGSVPELSVSTAYRFNIYDDEISRVESGVGLLQFLPFVPEAVPATNLGVVRVGGAGAVDLNVFAFDAGGGAVPGVDFDVLTTTLSWADGETGVKPVTVAPIDNDVLATPNKTFFLNLQLDAGSAQSIADFIPIGFLSTNIPILWDPEDIDSTTDTDGDGAPDFADVDDDGDGVADFLDALPQDASEQSDFDGDGIGDNADLDDDNDLIPDTEEQVLGLDPRNPFDGNTDNDGDGFSRGQEFLAGSSDFDIDSVPQVQWFATHLDIDNPVDGIGNVDRVTFEWSTELYGGPVSQFDIEDMVVRIFTADTPGDCAAGGATCVELYRDTVVVSGVLQPIGGVTRNLSDFLWDFNLSTATLSQLRNVLDITLEGNPPSIPAAAGTQYLLQDGLSLTEDSGLLITRYVNGLFDADGVATVLTQSTESIAGTDSDGDGVSDSAERLNGLNPLTIRDPQLVDVLEARLPHGPVIAPDASRVFLPYFEVDGLVTEIRVAVMGVDGNGDYTIAQDDVVVATLDTIYIEEPDGLAIGAVVHPDSDALYVQWQRSRFNDVTQINDIISTDLAAYAIGVDGTLTFLNQLALDLQNTLTNPPTERLFVRPQGDVLYTTRQTVQLAGDGSLGAAGPVIPDILSFGEGVFTPDGDVFYAASFSNSVSVFSVDGAGSVTALTPSPAAGINDFLSAVAIDPDGDTLWAAGQTSIVEFAVNNSTGELTFVNQTAIGQTGVSALVSLAIHPSGETLYYLKRIGNSEIVIIEEVAIGAGNTLTLEDTVTSRVMDFTSIIEVVGDPFSTDPVDRPRLFGGSFSDQPSIFAIDPTTQALGAESFVVQSPNHIPELFAPAIVAPRGDQVILEVSALSTLTLDFNRVLDAATIEFFTSHSYVDRILAPGGGAPNPLGGTVLAPDGLHAYTAGAQRASDNAQVIGRGFDPVTGLATGYAAYEFEGLDGFLTGLAFTPDGTMAYALAVGDDIGGGVGVVQVVALQRDPLSGDLRRVGAGVDTGSVASIFSTTGFAAYLPSLPGIVVYDGNPGTISVYGVDEFNRTPTGLIEQLSTNGFDATGQFVGALQGATDMKLSRDGQQLFLTTAAAFERAFPPALTGRLLVFDIAPNGGLTLVQALSTADLDPGEVLEGFTAVEENPDGTEVYAAATIRTFDDRFTRIGLFERNAPAGPLALLDFVEEPVLRRPIAAIGTSRDGTRVYISDTNTLALYSRDPSDNLQGDLDGDGTPNYADDDIDGDGVPNVSDNAPFNPLAVDDFDNDGLGDAIDPDDDNDGIADTDDEFPNDPLEFRDSDGDGVGDRADTDDDNDGVADVDDELPFDGSESADADRDGIGDFADLDDDNDGIQDAVEALLGTDPLDASDAIDDPDLDGFTTLEEIRAGTRPFAGDPATPGDVPGAGFIEFAAGNFSMVEGSGVNEIRLNRVWGSEGAVTVRVRTVDGPQSTAIAGVDYVPIDTTVTWNDRDQDSKTIPIDILADGTVDRNVLLTYVMSLESGAAEVATETAVSVLYNEDLDDSGVTFGGYLDTLNFEVRVPEHQGYVDLPVSRRGSAAGTVSVDYRIDSFGVTNGVDVDAVTGTLTWENGEAGVQFVRVPIFDDLIVEPLERFGLTLSNPTGDALIRVNGSTVGIVDDEVAGEDSVVGFTARSVRTEEGADAIRLGIVRLGGVGDLVMDVTDSTAGLNPGIARAVAGQDFNFVNTQVAWDDTVTGMRFVDFEVLQDTEFEGLEIALIFAGINTGAAFEMTNITLPLIFDSDDRDIVTDTNGDGTPDVADLDDDGDGVLDENDAFPLDINESADTDGDTIGNNADPDDDNDGLFDETEIFLGTDPLDASDGNADNDGDGFTRGEEFLAGTSDFESDSTPGLASYTTVLDLENPVFDGAVFFDNIDQVVYEWTTQRVLGNIIAADVRDLTVNVYTATTPGDCASGGPTCVLLFSDVQKSGGVVQDLISIETGSNTPPLSATRTADDLLFDFNLTTNTLSQFRSFFEAAAIDATEPEPGNTGATVYGVEDNLDLPTDGIVRIVRYTDGALTGIGSANLIQQTTTSSRIVTGGADAGDIVVNAYDTVVYEPEGSVEILVKRIRGSEGPLTVNYTTVEDSGTENSDYTPQTGVLTWTDGDAETKVISVPILDDAEAEASEKLRVLLDLLPGTGARLIDHEAWVTIADDERPSGPGLVLVREGGLRAEEAQGTVSFTVTRLGGSEGDVSVDVSLQAQPNFNNNLFTPAIPGEDVTMPSQRLFWADGDESDRVLTVNLLNDDLAEDTELVLVSLLNPQGGVEVAGISYNIELVDDDRENPSGIIRISRRVPLGSEISGQITVSLYRDSGTAGDVSVIAGAFNGREFVRNGPDDGTNDYQGPILGFGWGDGDRSVRRFTIPVWQDAEEEVLELFNAIIWAPSNGAVIDRFQAQASFPGTYFFPIILENIFTDTGDLDGDGIPNFQDIDIDGDGITNGTESVFAPLDWRDPTDAGGDLDSDGFSNVQEHQINSFINDPRSTPEIQGGGPLADLDGDDLSDVADLDDDGDNLTDELEIRLGLNPQDPDDGNQDSDGDGFADGLEIAQGTNPNNANHVPTAGDVRVVHYYSAVAEDSGTVEVLLERTGGSLGTVGVGFTTLDGSALAGSDYVAQSGAFTWGPGDTSRRTIQVQILDDAIVESSKTFAIEFSTTLGEPRVLDPEAIVEILDEDGALVPQGTAYFNTYLTRVNEGDAVTLVVDRHGGTAGDVSVQYGLLGRSEDTFTPATVGADIVEAFGTLTWSDGDDSPREITLFTIEDTAAEGIERIGLVLLNPTGGLQIASSSTGIEIIDDDRFLDSGVISFNRLGIVGSEATGRVRYNLYREGGTDGLLSVVADPTTFGAVEGLDFLGAPVLLNWNDGDRGVRALSIDVLDDAEAEVLEIFLLSLQPNSGGLVDGELVPGVVQQIFPFISRNDLDPATDTDNDGIPDIYDPDADNDGIDNVEEAVARLNWRNPADAALDNDGDGFTNGEERINAAITSPFVTPLTTGNGFVDSDGDGVTDFGDADDDNDGTPDGEDRFPLDPTEAADSDGDGVGDNADAFPEDAAETADLDGDGIGDNVDDDRDGDQLANDVESAFGSNPDDADTDGDGTPDGADNCLTFANDQTDSDGDGQGDACDFAGTFTDDFNAGPNPLWNPVNGAWAEVGGAYDAGSFGGYSYLPFVLTDFAVEVDVRQLDDGGIWLRSTPDLGGALGARGVLLTTGGLGGAGDGLYFSVDTADGAGLDPILNVNPALGLADTDTRLRIEVIGNTITVFVAGDPTPRAGLVLAPAEAALLAAGRVGLYDASGTQSFDNLLIEDLEGATDDRTLIYSDDFGSAADSVFLDADVTADFTGPSGRVGVRGYAGVGVNGDEFGGDLLINDTVGLLGGSAEQVFAFSNLPTHEGVDLGFLFARIGSWEGDATNGPDGLEVRVDGVAIFSQGFGAGSTPPYGAAPGLVALVDEEDLGFSPTDSAFDFNADRQFTVPHTADTLTISIRATGPNWQGGADEAVGIDNFRVALLNVDRSQQSPTVVAPLANQVVDEDTPPLVVSLAGVFDDPDGAPGEILSFDAQVISNPELTTVDVQGDQLTLTFAPNGSGASEILVTATDVDGLVSAGSQFTAFVNSVNDDPEVLQTIDNVAVFEGDEPEVIDLLPIFGDADTSQSLRGALDRVTNAAGEPSNRIGAVNLNGSAAPSPLSPPLAGDDLVFQPGIDDTSIVSTNFVGAYAPDDLPWSLGWSIGVNGNNAVWQPGTGGTLAGAAPTAAGTCPAGTTLVGTQPLPLSVGGGSMDLCELPARVLSDTTLTNDNVYRLSAVAPGTYIGDGDAAGATPGAIAQLTIEAGTLVTATPNAALIVTRESSINAVGTPTDPIVFTSQAQFDGWVAGSDGSGAAGGWPGIVLTGTAPTNSPDCGAVTCDVPLPDGLGFYGGSDAGLSSGTLAYAVIRDAGGSYLPGGTLADGLALFGVGSGTSLSFVQTHNTDADGIDVRGGTLVMDHLIVSEHGGDGLSWTEGWRGGAQFVHAESNGGQGIQGDSNALAPNDTPVSQVSLANVTVVGTNEEDLGVLLFGGTGAMLYNSIITNAETCLDVDQSATFDQLRRGNVRFENVFLDCFAAVGDDADNQGDSLVYEVVGNSNPGQVGATIAGGTLTLDFGTSGSGTAVITVQATDAQGAVASTSFEVEVTGTNTAPMIVSPELEDAIVFEGTEDYLIDLTTVIEDADIESPGDTLTYEVTVGDPTLIVASIDENDVLALDFQDGQIGETTITITATDEDGETVSTTLGITVLPVNAAGIPGVNVKVSGPTPLTNPLFKPDTTLRQQNEVECAMRPDNELQMFCGFNDYRGADDPEVGDSWQGIAMTRDGGLTWKTRLAPGWKSYPQTIGQGFAADPAIAPVPGAMVFAFIASDRDNKGPGGLYFQRWWEQGAESGLPWTPEKETYQAVAGDVGRFIDKEDILFTLDEPGARFNPGTGNYYLKVAGDGATWEDAQAAAAALGGNLVTINDDAEQAWLRRTFPGRHWIGLNDADNEGTFEWVSGEPFVYDAWLGGQPDAETPDHDYAVINAGPFGEWADESNSSFVALPSGIAEFAFDPDPSLEPSTITLQVELEDAPEGTLEPRTVPAGTLTAAYAEFVDTPPTIDGFEGFEAPDFEPGNLVEEALTGRWSLIGGGASIERGTGSEGDQVLVLRADNSPGGTELETIGGEPFSFAANEATVVKVSFDYSLFPVGTDAATYRVELPFADVVISNRSVSIRTADPEDNFEFLPVVYNRLTFVADYETRRLDVFVDGAIFSADLRFKGSDVLTPEELLDFNGIRLVAEPGPSLDELRIDNLSVRVNETNGANMMVVQSRDLGRTWTDPVQISADDDLVNQGVALAAAGERIMAVWRRFTPPGETVRQDALLYSLKEPGSDTWTVPAQIPYEMCPFDLAASDDQFRSNAFPTVTSDGTDFYVFWSDRNYSNDKKGNDCFNGLARIVMTRLTPDNVWTQPEPLEVASPEEIAIDDQDVRGHQFMPNAYTAASQVQVAYYDTRYDESGVFTRAIDDARQGDELRRHTVDVRATRVFKGLIRPSVQVTQFQLGIDETGNLIKLERSFSGARLFKKGLQPFLGDYITVAGPPYRQDANGTWVTNQADGKEPAFFVAWADNRDLRGNAWGAEGTRSQFSPAVAGFTPGDGRDEERAAVQQALNEADPSGQSTICVFDPSDPEAPDLSLTRDQNIYGSMLYPGLRITSPTPFKPADFGPDNAQRGHVIYLQNFTEEFRTYKAIIVNQPEDADAFTGRASFSDFPQPPFDAANPPDPVTETVVVLPPRAAAVRTVYVTSDADSRPAIEVRVIEQECTSCQSDVIVLNGNDLAPDLEETEETQGIASLEIRDPVISQRIVSDPVDNPGFRNPGFRNPGFRNPGFRNPGFRNPGFRNPGFRNPGFRNPGDPNPGFRNVDVENPGFRNPGFRNFTFENIGFEATGAANPGFRNPGFRNESFGASSLFNPGFRNPALEGGEDAESITDVTWTVENTGNTVGSFNLNPFSGEEINGRTQLLVTKTYVTQVVRDCQVVDQARNQVVLNIPDPDLSGVDLGATIGSIFVEPGEQINVTLRIFDAAPPPEEDLGLAVTAQGCNTTQNCEADEEPPRAIDGTPPVFEFEPFEDASGAVSFVQGSTRYDRRARRYSRTLTLTNSSNLPVPGEVRVRVQASGRGIQNPDGVTEQGDQFVQFLEGEDAVLEPGQSITVTVFRDRRRQVIDYVLERKPPSLMD